MAVKIAGIIVLGLSFIGLLVFIGWRLCKQTEIDNAQREHRLKERAQTDDFVIRLFEQINTDADELNNRLLENIAKKDEQILKLQQQIYLMKDIAASCGLKDIYANIEFKEGQA